MKRSSRSRITPELLLTATTALIGVGAWALARAQRERARPDKTRQDMPSLARGRGLRVERAVTIMRPPEELYRRWRDLSRLPEIMPYLESVVMIDDTHSRWTVRGPGNTPICWDAELVADEPGRLIAWRSIGGADVDNAGSVRFTPAPDHRGSEVKVVMSYAPPIGRLADAVATAFGRSGEREVREGLRRFKQWIETDEVATGARNRQRDAPRDRVRLPGAA
jgi:uncharacterized membrane protein